MKPSTILLIGGLLIALAAVVWWDWSIFSTTGGMPAFGWIALVLGALATIALGSGLMFLVFYSSRRGYDDIDDRDKPDDLA
jgi:acid phosphatase family membrane protein YuiD